MADLEEEEVEKAKKDGRVEKGLPLNDDDAARENAGPAAEPLGTPKAYQDTTNPLIKPSPSPNRALTSVSRKIVQIESQSPTSSSSQNGGTTRSTYRSNIRISPYPKRNALLQLEKLTMTGDACGRVNCACSRAPGNASVDAQLNYARACAKEGVANAEWPARLREYQREKDEREIFRAVRLKMHSNSKVILHDGTKCDEVNLRFTPFEDQEPNRFKDFGSLASEVEAKRKNKEKQAECVEKREGAMFQSLRADPSPHLCSDPLNLSGLVNCLPKNDAAAFSISPTCSSAMLGSVSSSSTMSESCSVQARRRSGVDLTVDELACYLEDFVYIPRKMSSMAEQMYM